MKDPEQPSLPDPETSRFEEESAWLKKNCHKLLYLAREFYYDQLSRGALVITAAIDEPLDENTSIHYAPLEKISNQKDETSQRLEELVASYRPQDQFVAVFLQPGEAVTLNMYQIRVREEIVKLVDDTSRAQREELLRERIELVSQTFAESRSGRTSQNGLNGCQNRHGNSWGTAEPDPLKDR
jgi:hypothetical protein